MQDLQEMCRAAKDAKHMTYAEIAEKSGIVEKTVKNFFSPAAKSPMLGTAGPICRALGVSLDKYCGIVTNDNPSALELAQQENAHLAEQLARLEQSNLHKNRVIIAMAGFILFLVAYMASVDLLDPTIGLFRGEFSAAGAVALLGFSVAAVFVCIIAHAEIKSRRGKK